MSASREVPSVDLPNGGRMPMIGFGTWKLRHGQARAAVLAALEVGYRHIDTATMYNNEAEIGQALADSGLDRAEVFVTTKIRPSDARRARDILRQSLQALRTDYIDLWLVHWPPPRRGESRELWNDLLAAQSDDLVRDVGVSNYGLLEIDDLTTSSGHAPAVNQIGWGPTLFDERLLAGHADRGVPVEAYSSLKNTNLGDPALAKIAAAHGVTPAQVVLRWHLEHNVIVIPKSAQPDRISTNLDVLGFSLTPEEVATIDGMADR
jgi:2,5-diketo-D-gluconate reductase A